MSKRLLTVLACLGALLTAGPAQTPSQNDYTPIYKAIRENIRESEIQKHLDQITKAPSRLAGSEGERRALEYAEGIFNRLGFVNIRKQPFSVTVPDPEAVGTLSITGGENVTAYPLWPNLVRTSTCDVSGPIVYGGMGSLDDLKGLDVAGSIVILEFNTGTRWRNAAKLGAKAIVFIEPSDTDRVQAEDTFSSVPLGVPRFWLPLRDIAPVLQAARDGKSVRLSCKQNWVLRETYNLLADLPGSVPAAKDERILLSAYADSMSAVPGLAPGADSASGLAALLELARLSKERSQRRPMTFMVTSAHFIALQGEREWVEHQQQAGKPDALLTISLDLSSTRASLAGFSRGWFYNYRNETTDTIRPLSRILRDHANRIAETYGLASGRDVYIDAVNDSDNRTWKNNIPGKFAMSCEPMIQATLNALTFATVDTPRPYLDTPLDTLDRVNVRAIADQTRSIGCLLAHLRRDSLSRTETSPYRVPLQPTTMRRLTTVGGFGEIEGRVVVFDASKSFIPDVPVEGSVATLLHENKTLLGVRAPMIQLTEPKTAHYSFIGVSPVSARFVRDRRPLRIAAFRMDPDSGNIDYGPAEGVLANYYSTMFMMTSSHKSTPIVAFPCVSQDIYDLSDPQDFQALPFVMALEARSEAVPKMYGLFIAEQDFFLADDIEDTAVLFAPPNMRYKLIGMSMAGEVRMTLTNSSDSEPTGTGFGMPGSEDADTLHLPALQAARDMIRLNESRIKNFAKYKILSDSVLDLQAKAKEELGLADQAVLDKDWAAVERHSRTAWAYALRAHPVIQGTNSDVINGVIFYLFLLLPFSFFLERLLIAAKLLTKQIMWSTIFFIASFALIYSIHPAFEIIYNPAVIFVAFVMGTLSLVVGGFIVGKFETSLKALKAAESGVKEIDLSRGTVAFAAFSLGISNMRRRKARTILTTLTLVVLTFIVLSFTSIVPDLKVYETASPNQATYSGILVRDPGLNPIQRTTTRILNNLYEGKATLASRAFFYGAEFSETPPLSIYRGEKTTDVRAVLGLESGEAKITRPQDALLPGGRWFNPGERGVIVLTRSMADKLGVGSLRPGADTIRFAGMPFKVVGVIEDDALRAIRDLDGDGVLPADLTITRRFQTESRSINAAFRSFLRLDPEVCVIIPTEDALSLGGQIRSVAVHFDNPEDTRKALDELMPRIRMNVYAAVPEGDGLSVKTFSTLQGSKSTGLGLVVVQMLLAAVFILNTMIASVYERKRDISIFSAIGLAPNHIAALFFAESLVYGVFGTVMGYFLAQGVSRLVLITGILPGLNLNFSASSAVMAAVLVMALVLLSTIYPAKVAARIAAPALQDDFADEPPEGDEWELVLPFRLSEDEAPSLIAFFADWFKAYEEFTIGSFVTSGTTIQEDALDGCLCRTHTTAWLAPFDLGVSQEINLAAHRSELPGVCKIVLTIRRESGEHAYWLNVNKRFLPNIRKQFLAWRTSRESVDAQLAAV
ncbi:MAG: M28 family peptidase [Fimbriimonadaceae bacterium]|nr:M28 family peptidase [Fimbriimonadaceae bacterium]